MKDKHLKRRGGAHIGDVLESFTANQLAWIGAVTIAYNEAEAVLHRLLGACIDYPGSYYDVSSRINGVDGLREIVMSAVKKFGLTAEILSSVDLCLTGEGFSNLKTLRDLVVHATMFDMSTAVARGPVKQGKWGYILLTEEALEGLYTRLALVKKEMNEIETIIVFKRRLKKLPAPDDQHEEQFEESIQVATARLQSHQKLRRSLPPLPTFPPEPNIHRLEPHRAEPRRPPPGA
jgi:hypothetical protein